MKIKTLGFLQTLIGVFFLFDGVWGLLFSDRGILIRISQEYVVLGVGLLAFITGVYNLKQKK